MAKICRNKNKAVHLHSHFRDVAQSGLEYASGGRVVAGSNPVSPNFLLPSFPFASYQKGRVSIESCQNCCRHSAASDDTFIDFAVDNETTIRLFVCDTMKRSYRNNECFCAHSHRIALAQAWGRIYHLHPGRFLKESPILSAKHLTLASHQCNSLKFIYDIMFGFGVTRRPSRFYRKHNERRIRAMNQFPPAVAGVTIKPATER